MNERGETNEDGIKNGDCCVSFHFHNGYYVATRIMRGRWFGDAGGIQKPSTVEFLVQVGNSFIFFNGKYLNG